MKKEETMEKDKETKTRSSRSKRKSSKEDKLKKEMEELKTELEDSKDKYLRLFAEFDNFKKRNIKERLELIRSASRETIESMLPILDDFDRAKTSADDESNDEVFSEGVNLVYNKIYQILGTKGLKSMESNGKDFDPEFHEAISEIPAPNPKLKGKVIDTIEKGYFLNDIIIRYAKVVVGK